jgi:anaerobic selenocysteine-containing dehydrogenase
MWLQIRPGTDCALLLGMINVIIEEELYDKEFVTKWCHGFEELAVRAREYPAKKEIVTAARMFATNKPSCAMEGMGVAHQPNSYGAIAARHIISAIVGNVDVQGGEELLGPAPFINEHEIEMADALPKEQRSKILGNQFRLYSWPGYELVQSNIERVWGKRCDMFGYTCMAPAPSLYKAIAYSDPYPVRALITLSSNPMVTIPNTKLVHKALKSLDLYVVVDYFMTPSAQLADYVLPSAMWEAAVPPSIPGKHDRRTDFHFWRGLGIRLGQKEFWPWETLEAYYDYRLEPMGFGFKELLKMGTWAPEKWEYKKYEKMGFGTPTGKIELYSTVMETLGYDPLPYYQEPHTPGPSCKFILIRQKTWALLTGIGPGSRRSMAA